MTKQETTMDSVEKLRTTILKRDAYRAMKRDLIGMEEENVGEIVLQKCSGEGDYFEIAEHSALIYYYYVVRALKIKGVRFEADCDSFFEQYKIGRIRVRNVSGVRERIKRVGMYGGEHVMMGRIVFMLKKSLTKEQLKALKRKESKRRLDLNKTVEIEHAAPLFYRNLAEMIRNLHVICSSKLNKLASQTNGVRMVTLVDDTMSKYLHSTDLPEGRWEERREDWAQIRRNLYKLKYEIQIIDIAKLWAPEICLDKFEQNDELIKLANMNLIKIMGKIKKNEIVTAK